MRTTIKSAEDSGGIEMREIKFRAWDKENKRMLKVDSLCFSLNKVMCEYPEYDNYVWETGSNFEVMQYTGLKDKNDKDMYEDDIVKLNTFKGLKNGKIIFKDGCFWALVKEFNTVANVLFPLHDNEGGTLFEVIGNIYENSELLEG